MKKLKNIILSGTSIVFGILMYVFMGCANFNFPGLEGFKTVTKSQTLFQIMKEGVLENEVLGNTVLVDNAGHNMAVVMGYFLAIAAGLMILCSIVRLLTELMLIPSAKIAKISYFANILTSFVVMVSAVLIVAGVGTYISANELKEASDIYAIGWAAIVNLVVGVLSLVAALFARPAMKKAKKSKKSKK